MRRASDYVSKLWRENLRGGSRSFKQSLKDIRILRDGHVNHWAFLGVVARVFVRKLAGVGYAASSAASVSS